MKILKELRRIDNPKLNIIDSLIDLIDSQVSTATSGDRFQLVRGIELFFRGSLNIKTNYSDPTVAVLELNRNTTNTKRIEMESMREWKGSPTEMIICQLPLSQAWHQLKNIKWTDFAKVYDKADLKTDVLFIIRIFNGNSPASAKDFFMSAPKSVIQETLSTSKYIAKPALS